MSCGQVEVSYYTALIKASEAIAERDRPKEAQRESEKQFKDVLDNTTTVIYIKDTRGRYMFINRRYSTGRDIPKLEPSTGSTVISCDECNLAHRQREPRFTALPGKAPVCWP